MILASVVILKNLKLIFYMREYNIDIDEYDYEAIAVDTLVVHIFDSNLIRFTYTEAGGEFATTLIYSGSYLIEENN